MRTVGIAGSLPINFTVSDIQHLMGVKTNFPAKVIYSRAIGFPGKSILHSPHPRKREIGKQGGYYAFGKPVFLIGKNADEKALPMQAPEQLDNTLIGMTIHCKVLSIIVKHVLIQLVEPLLIHP